MSRNHAADWLDQLAEALEPDGEPARTGAVVRSDWEQVLHTIVSESADAPRWQPFAETLVKVSGRYAPGLFHSYDLPEVPRTNNERESEFRGLRRRLLSTTGQTGAVKRLLLRAGAWELIPGPSTLAETVRALAQVAPSELRQEQARVRTHRQRFRLHTRSTKQSEQQLKGLVRRWKALPATAPPE